MEMGRFSTGLDHGGLVDFYYRRIRSSIDAFGRPVTIELLGWSVVEAGETFSSALGSEE